MERITVRKPRTDDFGAAMFDLCSLRAAPALAVSAALIVVLTGSLLNAVLTVILTSYIHAFWSRLVAGGE